MPSTAPRKPRKPEPPTKAPSTPKPTGKDAPTEPAKQVDPAVEAVLEQVEPAPGYALVRLLLAEHRHAEIGLPKDTVALLEAAMVRFVRLNTSDDTFAREFPEGSVVFASLEGIAPLLNTHLFLLPLDRVQGALPVEGLRGPEAMGFTQED